MKKPFLACLILFVQDGGVEGDGYGGLCTACVVDGRRRGGAVQHQPAEQVHGRGHVGGQSFAAVLQPSGRHRRPLLLLPDDAGPAQHPTSVYQQYCQGAWEVWGAGTESQEPPVWKYSYSLKDELRSSI